tara:strand:+ start:336 stop:3434 length:3099 start_codon:yes stop_codon:yes gene_type:complete
LGILDWLGVENEAPPGNRLAAAIQSLEKYYTAAGGDSDIISRQTIKAGEVKAGSTEGTEDLTLSQKKLLQSFLYENTEGAYFLKDIMYLVGESLGDVDLAGKIGIFYEPGIESSSGINVTDDTDVGVREATVAVVDPDSEMVSDDVDVEVLSDAGVGTQAGLYNVEPDAESDKISNPTIGAVEVTDYSFSFSDRHTTAATIFLNSIPTIEMSQCAPYLNLIFVSDVPSFVDGFGSLSIVNFAGKPDEDSGLIPGFKSEFGILDNAFPKMFGDQASLDIPTNVSVKLGADQADVTKKVRAAGMEMFTAPQTMVDMTNPKGVLNPAAPLMSLESMTVDVAGLGQDILANKTGTLTVLLHDRSRMPEIAPLIAADQFASTYIIAEYGWTHPQATGATIGNVYADFLNSLRGRAIFNIVVSNINILDNGQVRITMRLATRGATEMNNLPIGSGMEFVSAVNLQGLMERILFSTEMASISGEEISNKKILRDIRQGISLKLANIRSPRALIPIEQYREILTLLKDANDDEDLEKNAQDAVTVAANVKSTLTTMLENMETNSTDSTKYSTLRDEIAKKEAALRLIDVFNDDDDTVSSEILAYALRRSSSEQPQNSGESSESKVTHIYSPSLGQVLLTMVGPSLATCGKFDEVQFLFYPFNDHAGYMANKSLARFKIVGFDKVMHKISAKSPGMTIKTFMSSLFSQTVEKIDNPNYGLEKYYARISTVKEDKKYSSEEKNELITKERSALNKRLGEIYEEMGGERELKFSVPDVNVFMETLPAYEKDDDGSYKINPRKSIMRIHVYDAEAGIGFKERLANQLASSSGVTVTTGKSAPDTSSGSTRELNQSQSRSTRGVGIFDSKLDKGEIVSSDHQVDIDDEKKDRTSYFPNLDMRTLKDAIKSVVPSVTLGTQFTNVKSIRMSSSTSGDVNNTLLLNAITERESNLGSQNRDNILQDVFVIPTSADMAIMGFPLIEYGQKFYVDMGTGTTADNFYYVVGIRHSITAGEFTTNVTLKYNGSATIKSLQTALKSTEQSSF